MAFATQSNPRPRNMKSGYSPKLLGEIEELGVDPQVAIEVAHQMPCSLLDAALHIATGEYYQQQEWAETMQLGR
jgi:hypothetical protein